MTEKRENPRLRERQGNQRLDKKKKQKMESMDRISQLPDHVVHYILSFIRCPREVARTSILSKRWRELWLCGCELTRFDNIMLPHLQKLCLRKVMLNEQIIQNLISKCKFIYDLRLIHCSGLKELWICDRIRLNRVEIHQCIQLRKVELDCLNLHTFWFHCEKSTPCKVSLASCKSLKKLTLGYHQVKDDFCEKSKFYDFPLLEALDLSTLDSLKCINISNPQLQKLALKGCKKMKFVSINAPNLRSFEFQGKKMPRIEMHPCSLRDAKLSFEPIDKSRPIMFEKQGYFPKLMDFIRKFDHEGSYKLVIRSKKNIVIYENLDRVLLPELPNLSIDILSPLVFIDRFYSLLGTCHPETLCMIFPSNRKFPRLVHEKMKNREGNSSCCNYFTSSNKCWRHFLKDIKIEDFGDANNKWTSAWLNRLACTQTALPLRLTTLRLYWNGFRHGERPEKT
ncbi:putative F-box/LRR-repeat protein At3g28410 isoform X1 [Prosopis cineraria]|uniref:putative F-box/LRR-repeat protein At3g28410 isoform X1 n=1 Tax=Prosopis cineraria TaxID=364024 RepID=UPI0024109906|nr:putative F-box/LRR-repeat protein At3g28410 isoform X1 [Prosopis cineraria]XP_054796025.1 putative F-box/LRR-repeat protein At3g28410 isoform X1 [Prosopis cineraria]